MSDFHSALSEALQRRHSKEWPAFFAIAKEQISAYMATLLDGDSKSFTGEPDRHKVMQPLHESNIVGSEVIAPSATHFTLSENIEGDATMHRPVLDIDLPCWLQESTTPGHFHLIIDAPMPWRDYRKLLLTMKIVGILEQGFVDAALSRKGSWIRVPWVKKLDRGNE